MNQHLALEVNLNILVSQNIRNHISPTGWCLLWSPLASSCSWRRLELTWGLEVYNFFPFCSCPHVCKGREPWEEWSLIKYYQHCLLYHELLGTLVKGSYPWQCRDRGETQDHTINSTLKTVDGPSGKPQPVDHGAAQIIIPTSIDTTKVVGKVIPQLNGNLIGLCVSTPNMSLIDIDKYDDIRHRTAPWRTSWPTQRIRLFPVSLTVIPTPLSLLLGPAWPSVTVLSSSLTGMTINFAIGATLWTSRFTWALRSKSPEPVLPTIAQAEERGLSSWESCLQSTPQYTENLHPQHDSNPMFIRRRIPSI